DLEFFFKTLNPTSSTTDLSKIEHNNEKTEHNAEEMIKNYLLESES
ncbi:36567_t:CDS:1, partial [Racocetra persica]